MNRVDFTGLFLFVGTTVIVIGLIAAPEGREFSAEIVKLGPGAFGSELSGRIYAGKRKLRLESIENGNATVIIYDFDRNTMLSLDPQDRTYFKHPYPITEYEGTPFFYSHSQEQPCGAGYLATSLGLEPIGSRMAEKWRCEQVEPFKNKALNEFFVTEPWHIWYDVEHSLMVRHVRDSGWGQELQNIQLTPPPADIFEVPPDYRKVEHPFGLIDDVVTR